MIEYHVSSVYRGFCRIADVRSMEQRGIRVRLQVSGIAGTLPNQLLTRFFSTATRETSDSFHARPEMSLFVVCDWVQAVSAGRALPDRWKTNATDE